MPADNSAREKLCQKFLEVLESGHIPWHQSWATDPKQQYNAETGVEYHGVTQLILAMSNRSNAGWLTKSRVKALNGVIKPNAKPLRVEQVVMVNNYDPNEVLSLEDFVIQALATPNLAHKFTKSTKCYTLYNMDDVQGIPKKNLKTKSVSTKKCDVKEIKLLPDRLGIKVIEGETGVGKPTAYYDPDTDTVHIPSRDLFESDYAYSAVKLHEMCHSTSHPYRLDRSYLYESKADHEFGGKGYAREELRAEIASAFLMADFKLSAGKDELTNHQGYIQSWINMLRDRKEELYEAIDDAYCIESYILALSKKN